MLNLRQTTQMVGKLLLLMHIQFCNVDTILNSEKTALALFSGFLMIMNYVTQGLRNLRVT